MVPSIASSIVTRTPTAGDPPDCDPGARAPIAHPLHDLISPETVEKERMASGPAQPFEKAQFAEGKSLDFPSPRLGFSFPKAWIFLPPALILLPPLRADGELSR